jgi:hypothetical protein
LFSLFGSTDGCSTSSTGGRTNPSSLSSPCYPADEGTQPRAANGFLRGLGQNFAASAALNCMTAPIMFLHFISPMENSG